MLKSQFTIDKRETIKILRSLAQMAKSYVKESGEYATGSDFYNAAIREKLERVMKN